MQPVDPLAVAAVRLGAAAQLVGVAGVDQQDLEPLGLEQLVQRDPVDAGRFHGHRVDLVLAQEGDDGLQAVGVGGELPDQAGVGFGGEADADPVGARADVDAGGVRVQHGQGLDVGGLLLTEGLALGLGPGLATAVSLALGLSLSLLAAGGRAGGRLASDRRCGHGRAPRENGKASRGEGSAARPEAACGGGGSDESPTHCCKREPRGPGKESPGRGHQ